MRLYELSELKCINLDYLQSFELRKECTKGKWILTVLYKKDFFVEYDTYEEGKAAYDKLKKLLCSKPIFFPEHIEIF